ncbi:MAG: long-chain-fatty-acid--CoA ligase [Dermatophilaceae bacterium]
MTQPPTAPRVFPAATPPPGPHDAFYPADCPRDIPVPDESVWRALERNAAERPDERGLVFFGRVWTWRQVYDEAQALAGALAGLGLGRGDRLLLFMQNCPQFVVAFYAAMRLDAVVVPANPMYHGPEVAHYIGDSGARIGVASADIAGELVEGSQLAEQGGLEHVVVFDLVDGMPPDVDSVSATWPAAWREWLLPRAPRPDASTLQVHEWRELVASAPVPATAVTNLGEDLALIGYTSGTTGLAKGCMQRHRSLVHQQICAGYWTDMHAHDVALVVVPMFHITGLVMGMLGAVANASTVVILPRWDRGVAAAIIADAGVTHWPNIPTMVIDLLNSPELDSYDLSSLRYVGGGGVAMPEAIATKLGEQFGLEYLEGYGLTESTAAAIQNPRGGPRRGHLGVPFMGVEARVIDPATRAEMPIGEVGEIVLAGPQVTTGYWNLPTATEEAFVALDGGTFFRTGDLGSVNADGYFTLADRLKRMINASGFKVWPAEVENLLYGHPAVQEACVIRTRDPYRGETVKAMVVLKPDYRGAVTPEEIIEWAKDHMSAFKYPRQVEFVETLPHSAAGKLMWRLVQDEQDAKDAGAEQA